MPLCVKRHEIVRSCEFGQGCAVSSRGSMSAMAGRVAKGRAVRLRKVEAPRPRKVAETEVDLAVFAEKLAAGSLTPATIDDWSRRLKTKSWPLEDQAKGDNAIAASSTFLASVRFALCQDDLDSASRSCLADLLEWCARCEVMQSSAADANSTHEETAAVAATDEVAEKMETKNEEEEMTTVTRIDSAEKLQQTGKRYGASRLCRLTSEPSINTRTPVRLDRSTSMPVTCPTDGQIDDSNEQSTVDAGSAELLRRLSSGSGSSECLQLGASRIGIECEDAEMLQEALTVLAKHFKEKGVSLKSTSSPVTSQLDNGFESSDTDQQSSTVGGVQNNANGSSVDTAKSETGTPRISYDPEFLMECSKSPQCRSMPDSWVDIVEQYPEICLLKANSYFSPEVYVALKKSSSDSFSRNSFSRHMSYDDVLEAGLRERGGFSEHDKSEERGKTFGEFSKCRTFGEHQGFGKNKGFGEHKRFGEHKGLGEHKGFGDQKVFGEHKVCEDTGYCENKKFGQHGLCERKDFGERRGFGEPRHMYARQTSCDANFAFNEASWGRCYRDDTQ